jgi:hypothetical protein
LEIGSVSVFRWRIYEEIHILLDPLGRILSYLAVALPGGPAEYEYHHILSTQRQTQTLAVLRIPAEENFLISFPPGNGNRMHFPNVMVFMYKKYGLVGLSMRIALEM